MIHVFCAESNKKLLLIERWIKTYHDANVAPQLVWVLELDDEIFENIECILAIVLQNTRHETGEIDGLVPVHALVDKRQHGGANRIDQELIVPLELDENLAELQIDLEDCVLDLWVQLIEVELALVVVLFQ